MSARTVRGLLEGRLGQALSFLPLKALVRALPMICPTAEPMPMFVISGRHLTHKPGQPLRVGCADGQSGSRTMAFLRHDSSGTKEEQNKMQGL